MRRSQLLAVTLAVHAGLGACASPAVDSSARASSSPTPVPQVSSSSNPEGQSEKGSTMTSVRMSIDGQTLTAQLADNATARDLVTRLPLTLTFRDFNGVEKIAELPRPLTTLGAPPGADPDLLDIGYYAPSRDLVFYYGDVGYFEGIVRIGRFDTDIGLLQRQPDGFEVTIEQA